MCATLTDKKSTENQKRRGAILVYECLREDILWMRIKPGAAIDEVALAERFAISRTPIREALLLLQGDWLVEFLPNRTTIVAPMTMNNAGHYFDTHLVLARTAAREAARSRRAQRKELLVHHSEFVSAINADDFDAALRVTLELMRNITALPGNIFLQRYFRHSLDSGIRAKIMFYFPNAEKSELLAAADLLETLIEAISSGAPDESDDAMRAFLVHEIEISLRSLHPSFGDKMDVSRMDIVA
jgi:DNA-binding GntR family transcriptional regulator